MAARSHGCWSTGEDVACILIKEGYARPWTGRREDWCQSLDRRGLAEATLPAPLAIERHPRRTLGLFNWPRL